MDFNLNSLNQAAFQNAANSRNASHSKNSSTGVSASLAIKAPDASAVVAEERERTTLDLGQAFKMYNSPSRKTKSYFKQQSGEELQPNKPHQTTAPRSGW